ncbi:MULTISPECIES: betaine/proline/choline family ABC transporter ATP-binding protein [unclassified Mesorhizobium]|uniref:quaternary amine ABC transporter ATP-binding protein n=1 Tax=unclassified Mesorhizobium TaxID=325217 RepID=UPI0008F416BD|nr:MULTISPECIES: betaine/proline/choline family ABC transporter ATP-binding protein [unclassified Mesorhizobium]RJG47386.1 ATP-binding cassette domain-containing protein [Mesorhizobium sp. DCY119]SFU17872.1 glycine betaine/proline transport system ATP-binding protein [Mesorhizobium sp. YR577]
MTASEPKLICRNVWKVFGAGAGEFLNAKNADTSLASLGKAGLVGAVRDVNLEVHAGEIFVIMGLSGSGKSTLVRCLSRLVEPTSGEILFNGENLLAASESRMIEIRRHQMGMVFQHFALLPHLTVLANVAFPLEVQGVDRGTREARAKKMIDLVGLSGKENFFPRELSGGQQQRVGIARSLSVEPELWFLDEPFSALDPLIRREMQDEFMRLQSVLKKTIVFITHDFDEAIRLADRIAIMKDGAIVQAGTPEDIVLNPATPYVAEFTRNVPKAKVVKVGSIMRAANSAAGTGATVRERATIAEAAPIFANVDRIGVVDSAGKPVGVLHRDDVVELMMRG